METTATTLAWCLYYFALYPHFQEKARLEADKLLKDRDHITYEDYMSDACLFIKCFMKETLR
jgi:cytochrome P450